MAAAAGYVNPLARAHVTPERIDQGVDFAGSGPVLAIGDAIVTGVEDLSGSAWGGPWVQYQLSGGPFKGATIYTAEGITPLVRKGQRVSAGTPIAQIRPGSSTGIEMGIGSGTVGSAYAMALGGGYQEGQLTAAGKAFSDLLGALGGPRGTVEGRSVTGTYSGPSLAGLQKQANDLLTGGGVVSNAPGDLARQIVEGIFGMIAPNGFKIVLVGALLLAGVILVGFGTVKATGTEPQLKQAAAMGAKAAAA